MQDRRRTRKAAADERRIWNIDADLASQRDSTRVYCPSASLQRSAAPPTTRTGLSLDVVAGEDVARESPAAAQSTTDGRPRTEADFDVVDDQQQQQQHGRNVEQLLHVPVSAISTTTAALASSLLEKLASLRHGRSSMHDERQKQQKLIENRARKALRTLGAESSK